MPASRSVFSEEPLLPPAPIHAVTGPMRQFLHIQSSSGIVLLAATAIALGVANSPWGEAFEAFWQTPLGIRIGGHALDLSLLEWINDGLMMIFFFVVGLEIKRELVDGELREVRKAMLPLFAAAGGMLGPAAIYLALQTGESGQRGWGIPMATDIAFVVGLLAVLGPRIPHALRVLMLTLAIVDDIGAIVVIALGYTEGVHVAPLMMAGGITLLVAVIARLGVRSFLIYTLLGAALWYYFHESGVHATIGGVILGLMTPASAYVSLGRFAQFARRLGEAIHGDELPDPDRPEQIELLRDAARETFSPAEYLERVLHPWVAFGVMPLFALANAGVPVSPGEIRSPVSLAIVAALVLGKPLGIVLASWLGVRSGLVRLTEGLSWPLVWGGACLGGIGFTMSLFIAGLAFNGSLLESAKIGVLCGSILSAVLGMALLVVATRRAT
jgi:NhaA family Na+:H+ antiporter